MGYPTSILVVLAAVALFALYARKSAVHTVAEGGAPEGAIQGELGRFVAVLNSANSEDDEEYVSALARLKKDTKGVLAESDRLIAEAGTDRFALRHSVVLAVAAMREPDALDFLGKVALNPQPLPPKEGATQTSRAQRHDVEDVVQGVVVALDAVDGIEKLADDGNTAANELLVKATQVDSNAIRGAALTALAARADRSEYLQSALSGLPSELRHLANLRRANVRDVPQVADPRAHLAGVELVTPSPPSLDGNATQQPRNLTQGRRAAPQIRGR